MQNESGTRYKGFGNIEREAERQIGEMLDGCKACFTSLSGELQHAIVQQLRPLAQMTLLNALEGRVAAEEKHFGYEWDNALEAMTVQPIRAQAAQLLLSKMPEIQEALRDADVKQRIILEWLYELTAGRIRKFTPTLVQEEAQLEHWRDKCADAYQVAVVFAEKAAKNVQERSRPKGGGEPTMNEAARKLLFTANMIAARKLFLLATETVEYFEEKLDSIPVKVPLELQGLLTSKVYVRFGLKPRVNYPQANPEQLKNYDLLLRGMNGNMLKNLQEALCPWTAEQALNQKIGGNILAEVFFGIVQPQSKQPSSHPDDKVFQKLGGNINRCRMLGFVDEIGPEQRAILDQFARTAPGLNEFLDRPSVQEALWAHRVDKTMVQICLNAAIAFELVRSVKAWRPAAVSTQDCRVIPQARSTISHVMQDLVAYHNFLMKSDYLAARKADFYQEHLQRLHQEELSLKEREKFESYYRPIVVVLLGKDEGFTGVVPPEWSKTSNYIDPATDIFFTDYTVQTPAGKAIICLGQGASPVTAERVVADLFDLRKPAGIDDDSSQIHGVRISEISFNELQTSCLHPRSIARMQFYTSFSAAETLNILRGSTQEPSNENITEALRPCFILKYKDHGQDSGVENFYCRVKPAQMVRVKYRTPTGETLNPCWDASLIVGGLSKEAMQERLNSVAFNLILIEGEKKAAMLAQTMLDLQLPYHVISLPGVWMGVVGPRKARRLVDEIAQFQMRDEAGTSRHCLIFFDNDKAYNAAVMDALLQTASVMQKEGARVYVPNLPFGKKIKGADDFALAHCRTATGINYQPLVDIIERATYIPPNIPPVKYPGDDQKRRIAKLLDEAEQVHELQSAVKTAADPATSPAFRSLFLAQAGPMLNIANERTAAQLFDGQNPEGKAVLMQMIMNGNPALERLKVECQGIPAFESGTTLREMTHNKSTEVPTPQPELLLAV
jgi:Domain of unknown function (DUF3854)